MKILIMAGGKGTRIAEIASDVPKPMIPINGKPILEYQIVSLREQGYVDYTLIVGHMSNVIRNYFGDGSKLGVHTRYIEEEQPLGTAGALYLFRDYIQEDFLLLNGDIIFDVDISRFFQHHIKQNTIATIFTHPNAHPYDSGIIVADDYGMVTNWLHKEDKRQWYKNRVNAGLHMLSPEIFRFLPDLKKRDLDRDILEPLIPLQELSVYDSPEYVKDMGTPERYHTVTNDIESGMVKAKNLSNMQKAIFLDRDGTINEYKGFLTSIDSFCLLDGVAEAIRCINKSGYLAIITTNQPVIARGELTIASLKEIHNKMETLLGQEGAYVDDIFYCPHHPHKGFDGERPEYKVICDCRKPKPGMLLNAAQKYNIDLSASWMIGDEEIDMAAGRNAGCHVLKIGQSMDGTPSSKNLLEAIQQILNAC